jgi:hypothetical protein
MGKMSAEHPVLMVYDKDGIYYDLLPMLKERGVKVIDTTQAHLHARLSAQRYWCKDLSLNKDNRMVIYRKRTMPNNNRQWVEEPYAAFLKGGCIFPQGPQDMYENICRSFLPAKQTELNQLFETGTPGFNLVNALLDGAAYPELEQLTGGKSITETTVGLLSISSCTDMKWQKEWKTFSEAQFPGLDTSGSTLQEIQSKLWTYLLFSEFVFDLPEALPDNLKSVRIAPEEMKEKVYLICDQLRNRIDLRERYVRVANKVTEQLGLTDAFAKAKHLGMRVTFNFENSVEYDRFISCLKEGKQNEAHAMLDKNKKDVWYQEDAEVAVFWNLAEQVIQLVDCVNKGIKADGTLKELVEWYAASGCEADGAFRKYHTERLGAMSMPRQEKLLTEYLNAQYRDFTERAVKVYQDFILQVKDEKELRNQGCPEIVYPALKEGKRVVLVTVDAFRYEMGKTFAERIERSYRDRVTLVPKVSYLPSITRFGMANHLDDIVLCQQDGRLEPMIDLEVVSTPADRINYLKKKTQVEVQDIRLDEFDATAIEESIRLLVVRSLAIDSAGEKDKLNGLATMEREMISLAKMLDDCKRLKFDLAVLVADHGFMLQPAFRKGDLIDKPAGSDVVLTESRMLAGSINESQNTLTFAPAELGANVSAMKLSYAKNFTVFTNGEVYFHEGLSLQENVVPMITVKLQEEKKQLAYHVELKYKGKTEGTVYGLRPLIDINTTFSDLFADDVNVKLIISGEDGTVIGKPVGKFYNDVTELVDIPSGATSIRQPVNIEEDYHGGSITITALNPETNATLSTLKLDFEID